MRYSWEFLFFVWRLSIRYRSCIFHSCIFHLCCLLLHFPPLHFLLPHFSAPVIADSTNFLRPFLGSDFVAPTSRSWMKRTISSVWERRPINDTPNHCCRFQAVASFSKQSASKASWGRKSSPNCGLFAPPVKIRGGWAKCLCVCRLQLERRIYLWRRSARRSARFRVWPTKVKARQQHIRPWTHVVRHKCHGHIYERNV